MHVSTGQQFRFVTPPDPMDDVREHQSAFRNADDVANRDDGDLASEWPAAFP
jgi:hypothetical protein